MYINCDDSYTVKHAQAQSNAYFFVKKTVTVIFVKV